MVNKHYQEFESQAENLLRDILAHHGIDRALYDKLLDEEKTRVHLKKRRGIKEQLRKIIEQAQSEE